MISSKARASGPFVVLTITSYSSRPQVRRMPKRFSPQRTLGTTDDGPSLYAQAALIRSESSANDRSTHSVSQRSKA